MRQLLTIFFPLIFLFSSCAWWNTKNARITVYNAKPYPCYTAVHYFYAKGKTQTRFFLMDPGETIEIEEKFIEIKPKFYVYSEPFQPDRELMQWILEPATFFKKHTIPNFQGNATFQPAKPYNIWPSANMQLFQDEVLGTNTYLIHALQSSLATIYDYQTKVNTPGAFRKVVFEEVIVPDKWLRRKVHYLLKDEDIRFEKIYSSTESSKKKKYIEYAKKASLEHFLLKSSFVKKGTFTFYNGAPYNISVAVNVQFSRDSSTTIGWYNLESGESQNFGYNYRGVLPNIDLFAKSNESDIVKNAHLALGSRASQKFFQPASSDAVIFKNTHPSDAFKYQTLAVSERVLDPAAQTVAFFNVEGKSEGYSNTSYIGEFVFYDPDFNSIFNHTHIVDETEFRNISLKKAKVLHQSLERKLLDARYFPNFQRDSPYMIGLSLSDHNGITEPGVKIINGLAQDIFGNPSPFRKGDIITSFNGQIVFGPHDLHLLLYNHAVSLNGGIGKPINFKIIRGDEEYSGQTTFRFNRNYPNWPKDESFESFFSGVLDALSLGFDDELVEAFSDDKKQAWNYLQTKVRRQQFHSGAFIVGSFGGAIVSPGRLLFQKSLKKGLMKSGLSKGVTRLASAAILEGAENMVWTLGNKSPAASKKQLMSELKTSARDGALFGIGFASVDLLRRR